MLNVVRLIPTKPAIAVAEQWLLANLDLLDLDKYEVEPLAVH
ncbi:hypothetical protein [Nostoc sp. ChiQUE01b]|nr:hypothetical protein [Nostoc sp. ChiQUE01b]MDZ8259079.1 hypothetical protein [Nostoc sp. ChiQUE01b]